MKIALAIERFSRHAGGAESYGVDLARSLISNGWEVHLYGYEWDGSPEGAIFHRIRKLPDFVPASIKILSFAFEHRRMVKDCNYDVALGFGNTLEMNVYQSHGGVHALSCARKLNAIGSPWLRALKSLLMRIAPKYHARAWIESAPFRRKPQPIIIAISDMIKLDIAEYYGQNPTDIKLVYNGVDPSRFSRVDTAAQNDLRKKMGFEDEILFLFMAYDFRKKGVKQLLHAARVLWDRVGDGRFGVVIVGSKPTRDLAKTTRDLDLTDIVRFRGPTRNPEEYYAACDVFVLPTFYDACSLVVFEAMISGLPCITTIHNGATGIITNQVNGSVLRDPWDYEEFSRAMEYYLDRDRLHTCSANARKEAMNYTQKENHRKMLEIFHEVAQKNNSQANSPSYS